MRVFGEGDASWVFVLLFWGGFFFLGKGMRVCGRKGCEIFGIRNARWGSLGETCRLNYVTRMGQRRMDRHISQDSCQYSARIPLFNAKLSSFCHQHKINIGLKCIMT